MFKLEYFLPFTEHSSRYFNNQSSLKYFTQDKLKIIFNPDIDIMAGVVENEGSLLVHLQYPRAENLSSAQEFSDVIRTLRFPNLDPGPITEFYTRNVNTTDTESLKQAFYQFYGDFRIACPTYLFSKLFAALNPKRNVLFYYWTYVSRLIADELECAPDMGVCEQSDIPYVFGEPVLRYLPDKYFSEYIMKLWTNFAKTG